MAPMFERSDQLDNAQPVVEGFLRVHVREAALFTERPGPGFFGLSRLPRLRILPSTLAWKCEEVRVIYSLGGRKVQTAGEDYYVAPGACVIGKVRLGMGASVWFNCCPSRRQRLDHPG